MTSSGCRTRSLLALLAVFLCGTGAEAASTDTAEIASAIQANHAAIKSRDIKQLAALWLQADNATLVNPRDTSVGVGWSAIKSRWEHVFDVVTELEIAQVDGPHTDVSGDVAWSVGIVHVAERFKTQKTEQLDLLETDIFVRRDGHWLIASHTARPM